MANSIRWLLIFEVSAMGEGSTILLILWVGLWYCTIMCLCQLNAAPCRRNWFLIFWEDGANLNVLYQHRTCPPNHCLTCVDAFLNNRKHVNVSCFPTLDDQSLQNRHIMVQYWFDGPPVEVKSKPHGNSRTSQPFFHTAESAKRAAPGNCCN